MQIYSANMMNEIVVKSNLASTIPQKLKKCSMPLTRKPENIMFTRY
jgi:hypothetical protein